jgi:hypothetical protein
MNERPHEMSEKTGAPKQCPFCKSQNYPNDKAWRVRHERDCVFSTSYNDSYTCLSEDEVEKWNTRQAGAEGEAKFYRKTLEQICGDARNTRARRLATSALIFWDSMRPESETSGNVKQGV